MLRNVHCDPIRPVNYFLMDTDVVSLVKRTYPSCKRMDVTGDKSAMENFFGSAAKGKDVVGNVADEEWEEI